MDHKKAYALSRWLMGLALLGAVGLLLTLAFDLIYLALAFGIAAWIGMIGMFLVLKAYYKCPHCGKTLSSRNGAAAVCPHCGEEL